MVGYYTTIPVDLCQYALVNRKVNQTKLYVLLKLKSSGYISYNEDIYEHIKDWAKELDLNHKTVLTSFEWLLKQKWVTINSISKSIHIIGYKKLYYKLHFETSTAIIYEPDCFLDFKAFCCAAVIIYYRNRKKYSDKQSVAKKERTNTNCRTSSKDYYDISCGYLAECLKVSKTTAYNFKLAAIKLGLIEKKKNLVFMTDCIGKPITIEHFDAIKHTFKDNPLVRRIRKGKKYIKMVEADLIKSNIHLKKKRIY